MQSTAQTLHSAFEAACDMPATLLEAFPKPRDTLRRLFCESQNEVPRRRQVECSLVWTGPKGSFLIWTPGCGRQHCAVHGKTASIAFQLESCWLFAALLIWSHVGA